MLKFSSQCGVIWKWGLCEVIMSWRLVNGICALIRRGGQRASSLSFCHGRTQQEDISLQPGRRSSPDTEWLVSWLPASRTVKNKFLLFISHQFMGYGILLQQPELAETHFQHLIMLVGFHPFPLTVPGRSPTWKMRPCLIAASQCLRQGRMLEWVGGRKEGRLAGKKSTFITYFFNGYSLFLFLSTILSVPFSSTPVGMSSGDTR